MRAEPRNVALGVLLVLLVGMFYPALMLGRRVAPEASLKSVPPWRQEWGPNPEPRARVLAAATQLGPRLAIIGREGLDAAVWNPWIGGGRPGWLSAPREGGAPLPIAAALVARPEWAWSGLLALTVAASFAGVWFASRWLGASAWGAAVAATAYALAGPVAAHWLDWRGSALALGPFALLPVLAPGATWRRHAAAWIVAGGAVVLSGAPALPFIALAIAFEVVAGDGRTRWPRLLAVALALAVVAFARFPIAWLAHVGGEAGAAATATALPPPPALSNLVRTSLADRYVAPSRVLVADATPGVPESAFLGLATVLLAVVGFAGGAADRRRLWGAVAATSLLLAIAPSAWLEAARLPQRPLGVLALAAALLAGHGVDVLCRRVPERAARLAGAALCAVLLLELAPAAFHGLPFAAERELALAPPLASPLPADGSRIVTIASTLPPDIAAAYGLADVRARAFDREPAYGELIRAATSGAVQTLDPDLALLGARWVLEPSPLRLVSGIVFGDVNVVEAPRVSAEGAGTARYLVTLPPEAGRVGLPRGEVERASVFLQSDSATVALEIDDALAEESAAWRWFGVPVGAPRGDVVLGIIGDRRAPESVSLAIDGSGLRIVSEGPSLRIWEWARALPFVRLSEPVGSVAVRGLAADRVDIAVEAEAATTLVVQVKHRPGLWRATANGERVQTVAADRVWTAIPVRPGSTAVVLEAAIPRVVWLPTVAAAIIAALLGMRRRTL